MEIYTSFKAMIYGYVPFLLLTTLFSTTTASICEQGKQYLNSTLDRCLDCTECSEGEIVARPCELHRDTLCQPIREFLDGFHPHRHHHQHHRGRKEQEEKGRKGTTAENGDSRSTSTEAPFSRAESLVWDWQAIALSSAVFACFLFFLAITLYSLHQAKQWRRLKDTFDADVEELSAKLSLMAAVSETKSDLLDQKVDGSYLNSRCVYLEQLLNVRKDNEKKGSDNVYIEEANSASKT